jgi:hypothetical protein
MRKFVAVVVVMMIVATAVPIAAFGATKAAKQQSGTLTGVARGADKSPLRGYTIRLRQIEDGAIAASMRTNQAGEFGFTGIPPGRYIVEIVDSTETVVGMSTTLSIAAGVSVNVDVSASALGALTAGTAGGFSLFGLGKIASVAVLGAGAAIGAAAIVVTHEDASPSR